MTDDNMLVGFSVSGGGARATAFTLGVLAELQTISFPNKETALDRIDFMSSNSGGSWAVATYLADRAASGDTPYSLAEQMPKLRDQFVTMSNGRVRCWAKAMQGGIPGGATFGKIYGAEQKHPLPRTYFNASMLPAHAPFVFTDAFLRHYQVESFGACEKPLVTPATAMIDLPIAYAAATSGSVPGFYASFAKTRLCEPGSPTQKASFCYKNRKGGQLNHLRLADGGLYDNIGYKSAYEVMQSQPQSANVRRAMILVNSAASMDQKSIASTKINASFLATTASNGVFAVQDSTFERLYRPMFQAVGVQRPILLDFYSAGHFPVDQAPVLLSGLDHLAATAAYDISCYRADTVLDEGSKRPKGALPSVESSLDHLRSRGDDCVTNNFYRVGNTAKTTYQFDEGMFTTLWQLGQLVVRMHKAEIAETLQ